MLIKRLTRPFRQLQGKLTLSYTLTSVVTFLFVEVVFIAAVLWFVSLNVSNIVLSPLKQEAPQATPYFVHGSPDREALTAWLHIINANVSNQEPFHSHPIFLTVVDVQGQTIASVGSYPVPSDTPLQPRGPPGGFGFRSCGPSCRSVRTRVPMGV